MEISVLFLVLGLLTKGAIGYSSGLVYPACDTMMPNHRGTPANTTEPPYRVFASNYSFSPGDHITVVLEAQNEADFKGFLLQARSVPGDEMVGHFTAIDPNSQILQCGDNTNSSVSHRNASSKSSISALWVASGSHARVVFRATFVQTTRNFWVGVESPLLSNADSPVTSSIPPNVTTTLSSNATVSGTSRPSSAAPSGTSTSAAVSSVSPPTHISRETCGIQKICLSNPSDCDPSQTSNCHFMSSTKMSDGGYRFEISGPAAGYVAFGFSDDQMMGNDDIYICVINDGGQVQVQHAYSEGRSAPTILPQTNVSASLMAYSGGVIQCVFTSTNPISTQPPVRQSRSSSGSDEYYVLVAYGPSLNGMIRFHGVGVFASENKVNLSAISNVTHAEHRVSVLIKAHGALMLIAWMTAGSLGMAFARYFKAAAQKPVLGKAAWFQSHLILMSVTVVATIIGFVLAFLHVKGWAQDAIAHAVIGCVVMGLAFVQPIIAFFRPSPESSKRVVFNLFHHLNAVVIKVLAVANLFLGLKLIDHRAGWMMGVMGGFLGWGALSLIAFEINAYLARKEMKKYLDKDSTTPSAKYEMYLLAVYLCGNLAFLITLLVGIGQS